MLRYLGLISILFWPADPWGHIGDGVYPIFELSDQEVERIELHDASVDEWRTRIDIPVFRTTDFFISPDVGAGAPYNPNDLDYTIWLGWHRSTSRIYFAMERIDQTYINEYPGGELDKAWRHDASVELMVDGDHNGGDYSGDTIAWTDEVEYFRRHGHSRAQRYVAIADAPDGQCVGYLGAGAAWVNALPYTDGRGTTVETDPATSVLEFFVTPFDEVVYDQPENSQVSPLFPGKIIGFNIAVPDFDTAPGEYRAYHSLSTSPATWRFAERFVDGRLVGVEERATVVEHTTWAKIKAAISPSDNK